jgi:hypothetical protein
LKTVTQCLKFEAALTTVQLTTLLKIVETGLDELNDHPRTFALIKFVHSPRHTHDTRNTHTRTTRTKN